MTTKAKLNRVSGLWNESDAILLTLSLAAAGITIVTFWDWASVWGRDSPLRYSAGLLMAVLVMRLDNLWGNLLAAFLSLLVVCPLSHDMFLEWCEYWFAGAGIKHSVEQALLPIWEPIHAVLAAIIFCSVVIRSIRRVLRRQEL